VSPLSSFDFVYRSDGVLKVNIKVTVPAVASLLGVEKSYQMDDVTVPVLRGH
jgi:hypothetical protein